MTSPGNFDLEKALDEGPDLIADALEKWRVASLGREKIEALLYATVKGGSEKITATEIKARINSDPHRYEAVLVEIKAEANYTRLLERHLANKKRAGFRTTY